MSSSNNIEKLREHLFSTLEGLANKDNPMDLDRAKTVATVAQVLVNSAMVEVKYLQATSQSKSKFIESEDSEPLPNGIVGRTVHRIR